MRPDNISKNPARLWVRWLGLGLLPVVPVLALIFLNSSPFATVASGGEPDLAVVRNGISGDFLILDAPGTARTVQPPSKSEIGEMSASAEVETRLNTWTPTLGGASRGN